MQDHCGRQEKVPKYPCWLWFSWPGSTCGCWAEPKRGIKHEPGLLLHWLNSSSVTEYVSWVHYGYWLVHREKSRKAWPDLPSLSLKWGHLSRFHQDHFHWCYNTNFCFWFSAVIWLLRANAPERSQVCFHLWLLLPGTKHHRFREVWNVWGMLPKAERPPNIALTQRGFISVVNFFNEILHQGL